MQIGERIVAKRFEHSRKNLFSIMISISGSYSWVFAAARQITGKPHVYVQDTFQTRRQDRQLKCLDASAG